MNSVDPRIRQLAESMNRIAEEGPGVPRSWSDLIGVEQNRLLQEAADWLRAAVAAGIAPPAERPTADHSAIWLDDEGFIYGEYQTSPPAPLEDAAVLRLVWERDVCSSKRELEDKHGAVFRLIGWSQ